MKYIKEIKLLHEMPLWGENDIHLALAMAYWQATAAGNDGEAKTLLARLSGLDKALKVELAGHEVHMLLDLARLGHCELNDTLKRVFFPRPNKFFHACAFYESQGECVAPLVDSLWEHSKSLETPYRTIMRSLRLQYARSAMQIGSTVKARRLLTEVRESSSPAGHDPEELNLKLEIAEMHFLLGEKEICRRLLREVLSDCKNEVDEDKAMRLFHWLYRCMLDFSENDEDLLKDYIASARGDQARLKVVDLLLDKDLPLRVPEELELIVDRDWREMARLHLALYYLAKNRFAEAEAARPREKFHLPEGGETGFYAGPLGRDDFYRSKARRKIILSWIGLIKNKGSDQNMQIPLHVCDEVCAALAAAGRMEEAEIVRNQVRGASNVMHNLVASAIAAKDAGREGDAKRLMKQAEKIQAKPRSLRSLRSKYIWGLFQLGNIEAGSRLLRRDPAFPRDSFDGSIIFRLLITRNDIKKVREFSYLVSPRELVHKFACATSRLFYQKKYKEAAELWLQGMLIFQQLSKKIVR